jgi:hypothetical protein
MQVVMALTLKPQAVVVVQVARARTPSLPLQETEERAMRSALLLAEAHFTKLQVVAVHHEVEPQEQVARL